MSDYWKQENQIENLEDRLSVMVNTIIDNDKLQNMGGSPQFEKYSNAGILSQIESLDATEVAYCFGIDHDPRELPTFQSKSLPLLGDGAQAIFMRVGNEQRVPVWRYILEQQQKEIGVHERDYDTCIDEVRPVLFCTGSQAKTRDLLCMVSKSLFSSVAIAPDIQVVPTGVAVGYSDHSVLVFALMQTDTDLKAVETLSGLRDVAEQSHAGRVLIGEKTPSYLMFNVIERIESACGDNILHDTKPGAIKREIRSNRSHNAEFPAIGMWIRMLNTSDPEALLEQIDLFFRQRSESGWNTELARHFILDFSQGIFVSAKMQNILGHEMVDGEMYLALLQKAFESHKDLMEWTGFLIRSFYTYAKKGNSEKSVTEIAKEYIQRTYTEPHDSYRDEIALYAQVSPSHLSRQFKQETGQTITEYVLSLKMLSASRYLRDTDNPVATVSDLCGFTDVAYFNRVFKRYFGKSPRKYRQEEREKERA